MRLTIKKLVLALSFAALTGCASQQAIKSSNNDTGSQQKEVGSSFPIAIPMQVSYQDEVKLLRINQMIADKEKVDDTQRAVLYYQRGLIYDRMGLTAHSRYDFSQSINLDPTFADPYNSLGVYLLMGEAYDEAFDAFDSAIELSDKIQYSYLHRAIGLALVERYDGAHQDIEHFYKMDPQDPYRVLWRYLINYNLDPIVAEKELQQAQRVPDDQRIGWSIINVMTGKQSETDFFNTITVGVETNEELAQRLCEAYYYFAHWHINNGDLNKGIYYLKLSVSANVKDFIEYKYALVDLNMIQRELQKQSEAELQL